MKVKGIKIWTRLPELTDEMIDIGNLAAKDFKRGIESGEYEDVSCLVFGSNKQSKCIRKVW